jgi:hypothetical protein
LEDRSARDLALRRPARFILVRRPRSLRLPGYRRVRRSEPASLGRRLERPRCAGLLADARRRRLLSRLAHPDGDEELTRASLDLAREAYVRLYAEAESIAQSSVAAATPREVAPAARRRTGGRSPTHVSFALRVAGRLPLRYRERLQRLRRVIARIKAPRRHLGP